MTTKHLLEPELRAFAEDAKSQFPEKPTLEDLREARVKRKAAAVLIDDEEYDVKRTEVFIPPYDPESTTQARLVRCLLYEPRSGRTSGTTTAAYIHLHGGGYVLGLPEASDAANLRLASMLKIVVLSVDYRLAPEHTSPAALYDAFAALRHLHEHAEELMIDRDRIGCGGESAGGGLSAALAIYARDIGSYKLCFTMLTYPMLDDRTGGAECDIDPLVGHFVVTPQGIHNAWNAYLGESDELRAAPHVPARVESYSGLPPCWMFTSTLDAFRDENIEYARALMRAGVPCELVVYPGVCHKFMGVSASPSAKRYWDDIAKALRRGLRVSDDADAMPPPPSPPPPRRRRISEEGKTSGERLRLGMLTPSSNSVLEPLTAEMLEGIDGITAHFSRFRVLKITLEASVTQFDDTQPMLEAADLLADAKVDAICWNGTSAGWQGFDADERLVASITERTGIVACTSVLALNEALRVLKSKRVAFVTPYLDEIQDKIVANYRHAGFNVVAERHLGDPGNDSFASYSEDEIADMCRSVLHEAKPDAIAIFCTNFRGAAVAPRIEAEWPGVTVLDTVSLALWTSIRHARSSSSSSSSSDTPACPALTQWGKLFSL